MRKLLFFILAVASIGCGGSSGSNGADSAVGGKELPANFLLGAHYYVWFPGNLGQGYLRGKLNPSQDFLLGNYSSSDPSAAEEHIRWAKQYGIDFFTIDWWPRRENLQRAIDEGFMRAKNLGDFKFCMFYESGDIAYNPATGTIDFDDAETIDDYVDGLVEIAERYFSHPSYLRINGRPVIVLYVTRIFTGDVQGMIAQARARIKALGYDIFIIGDEIFWTGTPDQQKSRAVEFGAPAVERIKLFDAITAYNFYEGVFESQSGYGANSTFISDINKLLGIYRDHSSEVPILPSVIPGYNDRGVRLDSDHFAIPRQWAPGEGEGSFLREMLSRVMAPNLDSRLPIGFVTSFNEWNEDTAIEPLEVSGPTTGDDSEGNEYTQGYSYSGFGLKYLETIKEFRDR